ncbi:branched-chain amino acid aminotransferase [Purpureocillium lavendulum]|uniref:EKC/KEOPS complex subunit BUD32 n=1 Tax=Purpureocillium lavendulum TaxID=1247861 RepID=A0AB34FQX4_9HYPO|nr:branched-chain amino acid aminotransferase [Purpureocillium lavendulum]
MPPTAEKMPVRPHAMLRFISRGATSWVYQVDKDLVLKIARDPAANAFQHENTIYDELEQHEPCPYLLQSVLRLPLLNFLPAMGRGSLEQRIKSSRRRGSGGEIHVLHTAPKIQAERWAIEIARAVAWLESIGYVHGDLRPANMLIDDTDHIKLADFDSVCRIGSICLGSAPPWARVQGTEAGQDKGTFGTHGPRTEQFALGSILYTITRGFEPYEEERDSAQVLTWLQNMVFPSLGETEIDGIVGRCWRGLYPSVKSLFEETTRLEHEGASTSPQPTVLSLKDVSALRERCNGLLDAALKEALREFVSEK